MAKLSALVIPAVIDTSGIDKGINTLRNKLSRVRGQGVGGNGTGSGFTSGISPYGGHGGAGGSPISNAMASAFGASAGSRSSFAGGKAEVWRGVPTGAKKWASRNQLTRRTTQSYYEMRLAGADFKEAMANPSDTSWEATDKYQRAQDKYFSTLQRQKDLRKAVNKGMRKRALDNKLIDLATSGAVRFGAAIGIGALAYKMLKGAGSRNMEERFGDITRFQGTDMYQAAVGLKRDYFKTPQPTSAQGFWMNMRQGTGGRKSFLEKLYTGLGDVPSNISSAMGQQLGVGQAALGLTDTGTKAQQQDAGMAAAKYLLDSGGMGWNGIVGNGIYNYFSRLFS